jgi:hypothetical protein
MIKASHAFFDFYKRFGIFFLAERVGFEPTVEEASTTVFETAPIGRSGTSPGWWYYSRTAQFFVWLVGFTSQKSCLAQGSGCPESRLDLIFR